MAYPISMHIDILYPNTYVRVNDSDMALKSDMETSRYGPRKIVLNFCVVGS